MEPGVGLADCERVARRRVSRLRTREGARRRVIRLRTREGARRRVIRLRTREEPGVRIAE